MDFLTHLGNLSAKRCRGYLSPAELGTAVRFSLLIVNALGSRYFLFCILFPLKAEISYSSNFLLEKERQKATLLRLIARLT